MVSGPRTKQSRALTLIFTIGGVLVVLALVLGSLRIIGTAISKVLAGQGAETYTTVWFLEVSYIGVLVDSVAMLLACAVALFYVWREESLWRDFERKYGARD